MIELEEDVASDVVFSEGVCVCATFYISEPLRDVRIRPGFEKVWKGRPDGWLEERHGSRSVGKCTPESEPVQIGQGLSLDSGACRNGRGMI